MLGRILQKPVNYVEGRVDEVRHQLKEDASEALAIAGIYIVLALILLLGILLISISLSYLLGTWIGTHWGFLIVGLLYLFAGLLYWNYFRKPENQLAIKQRVEKVVKGAGKTDEIPENRDGEFGGSV